MLDGIQDFFDSCTDNEGTRDNKPIHIQWSRKGVGFGEIYFYYDGETLRCENELMSKEFVKQVLCDMVDKAEFDDVRSE